MKTTTAKLELTISFSDEGDPSETLQEVIAAVRLHLKAPISTGINTGVDVPSIVVNLQAIPDTISRDPQETFHPIAIGDNLQVKVYDDGQDDRYASLDFATGGYGLCITPPNIPNAIAALLRADAYFRSHPPIQSADDAFSEADRQEFDQITAEEAHLGELQAEAEYDDENKHRR